MKLKNDVEQGISFGKVSCNTGKMKIFVLPFLTRFGGVDLAVDLS